MPRPPKQDPEMLRAALIGLQHMLDQVDTRIAELRAKLGKPDDRFVIAQEPTQPAGTPPKKRTMSASARRRIALAQKKRWAAQKAKQTAPAAPAKSAKPAKRQMSAEGRARIIAAVKKRWAAAKKTKATKKAPAPTEATPANS